MVTVTRRSTLTMIGGSLVSSVVGSLSTGAIAATPAAESEKSVWTTHGYVRRGGGNIHYVMIDNSATEYKDLPPVVLLHKLGGWVKDWRHIAPSLPASKVIAIDLPGHGDSKMDGPLPYIQSLPETAAMIKAALFELGIDHFNLIGNSLGGCVSTVISGLFPDAISKLCLIGVSLIPGNSRDDIKKWNITSAKDFDANGLPLPRTLEETKRFGTWAPEINDEMNQSRAEAGVWLRPSMRGVMLTPFHDYLARIKAPVLLINGERADYRKYEQFAQQHSPNIRIETIANSGAFTHQEKPAETIKILREYLTS